MNDNLATADAYLIASMGFMATGHWAFGFMCLVLSVLTK